MDAVLPCMTRAAGNAAIFGRFTRIFCSFTRIYGNNVAIHGGNADTHVCTRVCSFTNTTGQLSALRARVEWIEEELRCEIKCYSAQPPYCLYQQSV